MKKKKKKKKLLCKRLRKPLKVDERVLALTERLKKKDAPKSLYKLTMENVSFFNRKQIPLLDLKRRQQ